MLSPELLLKFALRRNLFRADEVIIIVLVYCKAVARVADAFQLICRLEPTDYQLSKGHLWLLFILGSSPICVPSWRWRHFRIAAVIHLAPQLEINVFSALSQVDHHRQAVDYDEAADSAGPREHRADVWIE